MSPREKEVVALILAGHSNKVIADKLNVTEKTIKFHLTNIFAKAGVTSRLELATKGSGEKPSQDELRMMHLILG